jgi:hypothetical protein
MPRSLSWRVAREEGRRMMVTTTLISELEAVRAMLSAE